MICGWDRTSAHESVLFGLDQPCKEQLCEAVRKRTAAGDDASSSSSMDASDVSLSLGMICPMSQCVGGMCPQIWMLFWVYGFQPVSQFHIFVLKWGCCGEENEADSQQCQHCSDHDDHVEGFLGFHHAHGCGKQHAES